MWDLIKKLFTVSECTPPPNNKVVLGKEGEHNPPEYYGYKGGFDGLTFCKDCYNLSLYEDSHPIDPCVICGGKVLGGIAGKWSLSERKWVGVKMFGGGDLAKLLIEEIRNDKS